MRRLSHGTLRPPLAPRRGLVWRALLLLALGEPARAHHAPGHGASEGIRTLNTSTARTPRATQRLLLLGETVRTTPEPNLNAATVSTVSALASFMPHPWWSLGVQAPWTFVQEDAPGVPMKSGYGDTRLEIRLTPHGDKLVHRVLTIGLNASLPTRTVRFEVDPGPLWSVAPVLAFSRGFERWSWHLLALVPVEHRPAGTAVDFSGAALATYRLTSGWQATLGGLVDVRLAARCTLPSGGSEWCSEGRATEAGRENGTTRGYATVGTGFDLHERWTLSASAQLPVTPRRDFEAAANIGLEARF